VSSKILHLILVESALELVPAEIANHPAIVKNARRRDKKPGETLLDTSLHYYAMLKLKDREKRGRPDIVHVSLLNALESPLNKAGHLRVYIHTYPGHVVFVKPETRIPRNYNRFVGLMEQLLVSGRVPPNSDDPLMYVKTMSLRDLQDLIGVKGLILLHEEGEERKLSEVVAKALKENYAIGVGGFPHGDFSKEVLEIASYRYSIYDKPLTTWIVVSRIITTAEHMLGILNLI